MSIRLRERHCHFQRQGFAFYCRYLFPVASLSIRAAAWLASFRMWTRLKCLSNRPRITSLCRRLFPLSLNCTAGQDEHFPERSSSSGDEVITSSGLFTPLVSHRPEPISSHVDFKLHHCAGTRQITVDIVSCIGRKSQYSASNRRGRSPYKRFARSNRDKQLLILNNDGGRQ